MKTAVVIALLVLAVCYCGYFAEGHHCDLCPKQEDECDRICRNDHGAKCGYCTGKDNTSCLCPKDGEPCPRS
uniref:Venom peptide HtUy3 n=1 Tax=Hadogenes troglodytes TaxID=1577150 RepID=A0A1B3IJ52_9SCOR|nr:venom peptide HtUy3 [Hadogenes troglodytes]